MRWGGAAVHFRWPADIYGALVYDTIGGVGQWHFHYDDSLEFIGNSDFGTQQWDEP